MSNSRQTIFCLSLLTLFLHGVVHAQISSVQVDHLVEDALKKFDVAGVAVGIVKDGKIIHSKGYGLKSITTKEKVDKHTQFAIASNSKAFTTASLAILVDEGQLSWQDKVKEYIPEFKMYNAYVTENFNIADLLTHRSGLGLGVGDLMFFPDGSDFTIKDIIVNFQHFKPESAFRTQFDYDNLLYIVAGEVIARVSGMTWEQFVQTRIMTPLNMDNSYSGLAQITDRGNLATPHSTDTGSMRTISHFEQDCEKINGAAGGIYSNVDDLCHWMLVHLNEGQYGKALDKRLFSAARQREMWRIHTILTARRDDRYRSHFRGYGLGWVLADIQGNMSVSHTGGLPGMLSKTMMIPDLELGIVVLTNTANGGQGVFKSVTQTILDSYLGLDDHDWTNKFLAEHQFREAAGNKVTAKVWKTVAAANSQAVNSADYIGVYEDPWFGKVEVFSKNEQLWIKSYRSPKLNGRMHYYKANAFAIKWEYQDMVGDAFCVFSLDEEGHAQGIKLKGISPNIDFSFDFHDLNLKRIK
jgi:CubicO group peptidase (beta-lactamase class C family)